MLAKEADFQVSKMERLDLAKTAQTAAHEFIGKQTVKSLIEKRPSMSTALGRELTNQSALIALIRHLCYRLGACDAALRDRSQAGAY